ncbi:MAG: hypothetical protein K9L57_10265 [Spirochaetaceae bacterium]|nr:hypothetical protein [Spirochaetia bacterium]MCF7952007.1 hypothetical protein [Spirochaetaceae bacterium]
MRYYVHVSKSVADDLASLPVAEKRFFQLLLKRLGQKMVSHIQKNKLSGQVLNIRSGHLRTKTFFNQTNSYSIDVDNAAKYAAIHELGGDIYPKKAKALRFKIGDQWVITKHVKMPKRPFIKPGVEEIINSPVAMKIFNGVFNKVMREGGWK